MAVCFERIDCNLRNQIFPFVLLFWIIWVLALYKWQGGVNPDPIIIGYGLISLTGLCVRYAWDGYKSRNEIIAKLVEIWPLLMLCAIAFALIIPTINDIELFDAWCYSSNVSDYINLNIFTYTFVNIRDYILCGHTTNGFTIFVLLGELLNSTYGLRLANYILYLISVYCFGRAIYNLSENNKCVGTIGTAVYAFSPWCLGLIGQSSIDNPSLYFAAILIYAYVCRKDLNLLLVGWCFCNTKETNVIYYSVFVFSIWIIESLKVISANEKRMKWGDILCLFKRGIYLVTPSVSWLIIFKCLTRENSWLSGVTAVANNNTVTVDGAEEVVQTSGVQIEGVLEQYVHVFGFTWANFIQKSKEIFIYNFSWILILSVILTVLYTLIKGKSKKYNIDIDKIVPVIVMLVSIVLFNYLYLDWDNPRYVMVISAPLTFICVYVLIALNNKGVSAGLLSVLAMLMLVQSFCFIDPIMNIDLPTIGHRDSGQYNRNYRALQECLKDIMRDLNVQGDEVVIYLDDDMRPYGELIYYNRDTGIITHNKKGDTVNISYPKNPEYDFYLYNIDKPDNDVDGKEVIGYYDYANMHLACYKD